MPCITVATIYEVPMQNSDTAILKGSHNKMIAQSKTTCLQQQELEEYRCNTANPIRTLSNKQRWITCPLVDNHKPAPWW